MGQYQVLRHMATGGMAQIFLARREGMSGFERLVVLKRILPEYAGHQEFVRMFLDEARIAATLHHTNIVTVHDIGEEQGQVYFAMEFLHGEDLARVTRRAGEVKQPLVLDSVLTIIAGVCAGLHYAHERRAADGKPLGIVHRDVSPHNVFVTYDGGVKLLDFGIAKATTSMANTRTGVLKGKVAYMSPEQAYSEPVDRRSDIFCIGILLWELTTGKRLYRRRSELETLKALVDQDAPPPSSVVEGYPAELETIVMKCLARKKDERWATVDALDRALEAFAKQHRIGVSPTATARMMRALFAPEIAALEVAQQSGANLTEHVIARIDATGTARTPGSGDWASGSSSGERSGAGAAVMPPAPSGDATAIPAGDAPPAAAQAPAAKMLNPPTMPEIELEEGTVVDALPSGLDASWDTSPVPTSAPRAKSITADPTTQRAPVRLPGVEGADDGPRRSSRVLAVSAPAAATPAPAPNPYAALPPPPVAPAPMPMPIPPPPTERVTPLDARARGTMPDHLAPMPSAAISLRPSRRRLYAAIGAGAVVGLVVTVLVMASGDDEAETTTPPPDPAPAMVAPTPPAPAPAETPAAKPKPKPAVAKDKDKGKDKDKDADRASDRPRREAKPSKPTRSTKPKPKPKPARPKKKPTKSDLDSLPI
jgi:serine/threonine protein kinase